MNSADGSMPTRFEPTASRHLPGRNYLNAGYTVRSWLLTTDHKRIAILYLLSITFFFVIGGLAATVVRLDLMTPQGRSGADRNVQQAVHGPRRDRWCSSF